MIPGSLFSAVSGFVDYSAKKCNLRKGESFQDGYNNNKPHPLLFGILLILLLVLIGVYVYSLIYVPWKVAGREGHGILYKLLLFLTALLFPTYNIWYVANRALKYSK